MKPKKKTIIELDDEVLAKLEKARNVTTEEGLQIRTNTKQIIQGLIMKYL